MLNSSTAVCKFYKSSRGCKFGTNCKFVHSIPPDISTESNRDHGNINKQTSNLNIPRVSSNISSEVARSEKQNEAVKEVREVKVFKQKQSKVCYYFHRYGNCKFGTKCRFVHIFEGQQVEPSVDTLLIKHVQGATTSDKSDDSLVPILNQEQEFNAKERKKPVCHYYRDGACKKGETCRFQHVENKGNVNISEESCQAIEQQKVRAKPERRPVFPAGNVQRELKRQVATDEEIEDLRSTEIAQLKKRFPKDKLTVLPKDNENDVFLLSFSSSDPDWPYDVKVFELEISFPKRYPFEMMRISLPEEQNLPDSVRKYVEVSIEEWIAETEKHNVKRDVIAMVFRPFLKWLDKNLEDLVTEGLKQLQRELIAKAAGLEFIPASQLKKKAVSSPEVSSDDTGSDSDHEQEEEKEFTVYKKDEAEEVYTGPSQYSIDDIYYETEDKTTNKELEITETAARGTEVRLRNLQLRESASTMIFTQIKLMIQCTRCHNRLDIKTPPNQVNCVACLKCNQSQLINYRPLMVHQFSSVIGYLDLEGCTAFDLIMQDCNFKLGCFSCYNETAVNGLPPGLLTDVSCHTCHKKMKVAADSAKFTELQNSFTGLDSENAINVPVMKIKKIPKDPRIVLGSPLPDDGTCKHYKKSFRWFRFPCCGKVYPCDICHDDKEDHEMVMANRMVCGHCCKEQPFALEKPCVACHQLMTKTRSSHWEGGKGCRDKVRMSKDDVKKYANTNKTVSRKAQEKNKPAKKKEKETK